jgi:hypothetical protein
LYGKVALSYSSSSAWTVLGVISFSSSFIGLLARQPQPIASASMEPKRA